MNRTRLVTLADAEALAGLVRENRTFMAPWDPVRDESYYTVGGQRKLVAAALGKYEAGQSLPHVIIGPTGTIIGRIALSSIERGSFLSARLGYFVAETHNGRGVAGAAIGEMISYAFTGLGLHRVEAGTLVDNARSQRALLRNGFVRIGIAPAYLQIAGRWQDHTLFQRTDGAATDDRAAAPPPG